MKDQKLPYGLLLAFSGLCALGGVLTLVPWAASKPNLLGYFSLCPFAPGATFACALLALTSCVFRARFIKIPPSRGSLLGILVLGILLLVGLGWSVVAYGDQTKGFQNVIATETQWKDIPLRPDGKYKGEIKEGALFAQVEIQMTGGKIEKISLLDSSLMESTVADRVFSSVIKAQNLQVDGITGATASSLILKQAIQNGLYKE